MLLRVSAVIVLCALGLSAQAQDGTECPWELLVGDFEFQRDGETFDVSWKQAGDGSAVIGTWDIAGSAFTELAGWQPDGKTLVSNGYGPNGAYWEMRSTKVTDTLFQGTMVDRHVDGTLYTGMWQCKRVNEDLFETLFIGVDDAGEAVERKGRFVRKK